MKIKYLKDAPQAKAGEVKEIYCQYANVLIKLGFAEIFVEDQIEEDEDDPDPIAKVNDKIQDSGENKGQDDVQELV